METIVISADRKTVSYGGKDYVASCNIRERDLHDRNEVRLSTNSDGSDGKPVMPKEFPPCIENAAWNVIRIHRPDEITASLGPIVIDTDAHQELLVWELDEEGGYDHVTDETIDDWGYAIHFDGVVADAGYSQGCMHILSKDDMLELGNNIAAMLDAGHQVKVVVVDPAEAV